MEFLWFVTGEIGLVCAVQAAFFVERGEVLLQVAVDALLIEGQELELFRFGVEDLRSREGGVDFRVFCFDFVRFGAVAEGEKVVFDGAGPLTRNASLPAHRGDKA